MTSSGAAHQVNMVSHCFHREGRVDHVVVQSGIPFYRTRVLYVPQRPSLLPGSPQDFLFTVSSLDAHKKARGSGPGVFERAIDIAKVWGIDEKLWDREWSNLSGGEAQRIALAAAIGLGTAEIILLDGTQSSVVYVAPSLMRRPRTNVCFGFGILRSRRKSHRWRGSS
jgi:ABC-type iron transport system FetAB ATPase subunit